MSIIRIMAMAIIYGMALATQANAAVDNTAAIVKLRTSCSENGAAINNCFTDLASLGTWIRNTRVPSAAMPLAIEIGPGTFNGSFNCENSGYMTLRGSGPSQTKIQSGRPLTSNNCTQLVFENLTISGDPSSGSFTQVNWYGGGTSRWNNVDLVSYGYGWVEGNCGTSPGQHYWFGSRIVTYSTSNSLRNYIGACDVSWFIGSEITSIANSPTIDLNVLIASGNSEIHVYGSVIRAISGSNITTGPVQPAGQGFTPIWATGLGAIHIHSSAIDAISEMGNEIAVLGAGTGSLIHANQTSYNLKTGTGGIVRRVIDFGGHVHAPYQWEPHSDVPFANQPGVGFSTMTGYDTAVVTSTSDGHPHMVIYDGACASKWFDMITKACK